jgi:hypothetical protein
VPINRTKTAQEAGSMHACNHYYFKSLQSPVKNFKKGHLRLYMHSNFILSLFVNSHVFQMFTPASFVFAEIFPNVGRTPHAVRGALPLFRIFDTP